LKSDTQLKQDVEAELRWDPRTKAAHIGVKVDHGEVALVGAVDTYPQRWAAEDAIKRVSGVRSVVLDLTVKILSDHQRSDPEIAIAILGAFRSNVLVPSTVTVKVQRGVVTLEGQATWNHQRDAAEYAVRYLTGVVRVHNYITLKPDVCAAQVKEKVEAALHRQATADALVIHLDTSGSKVTLTGQVSSWQAMQDASNAAWAAPGVTHVDDQLQIAMT